MTSDQLEMLEECLFSRSLNVVLKAINFLDDQSGTVLGPTNSRFGYNARPEATDIFRHSVNTGTSRTDYGQALSGAT